MKRTDLTDELFCERCGYLGKPEEFRQGGRWVKHDICPSCGRIDTAIVASEIEWCDECQERPAEKKSTLCTPCYTVFCEQLRKQADVRQESFMNIQGV